ncbi:DNA adenine methylase, partial [Brachyspira catarrhinii]
NYKWIVTYDVSDFIFLLYNKYRKSYLDLFYNINKKVKSKEYIFFSDNLYLPDDIKLI